MKLQHTACIFWLLTHLAKVVCMTLGLLYKAKINNFIMIIVFNFVNLVTCKIGHSRL
jgi:hypothetical protein